MKKTKTIKNRGEKQIKATEEHGKQLAETYAFFKKDGFDNYDSEKDSSLLFSEKSIFNEIYDKRFKK